MSQRVKDGVAGMALLAVLAFGWYVWSLGSTVMRHDHDLSVVINALVQNGTLRQNGPPAKKAEAPAPTPEAPAP